MTELPDGTVTFLFSDVEHSTRLLERDAVAAGVALARHHELFEDAGDLGSTLGPIDTTAMIGLGYSALFLLNAALAVIALVAFARWASARPGETVAPAAIESPA